MNVNLNKEPYSKHLEGEGLFSSSKFKEESPFELIQYPHLTVLKAVFKEYLRLITLNEYLMLEGTLEDGTKIRINELLVKRVENYSVFLEPRSIVVIGNISMESKFACVKFPIRGYTGASKPINIVDGMWSIELQRNVEYKREQSLFQNGYQVAIDLNIVIVRSSTPSLISEFLKRCDAICMILSLATNNSINYNRYILKVGDESLEVWNPKKTSQFKPVYPCVKEIDHQLLLQSVLSKYYDLSEEESKLYHTTIDYLCSTNFGYLEDTMLRIAQAWEAYFNFWNEENYELPTPLVELKTQIKETIKNWKKSESYNNHDPEGFVSNRLITSLYWNKLVDGLNKLVENSNLDESKVSIDFKMLVEVRNSIAHSGRFREKGREHEYVDLLESAIFGLQLLLLKKIGYDGNIYTKDETRWRVSRSITEYFLN